MQVRIFVENSLCTFMVVVMAHLLAMWMLIMFPRDIHLSGRILYLDRGQSLRCLHFAHFKTSVFHGREM